MTEIPQRVRQILWLAEIANRGKGPPPDTWHYCETPGCPCLFPILPLPGPVEDAQARNLARAYQDEDGTAVLSELD